MGFENLRGAVDLVPEDRLVLVELGPHPGILGALAGEEEEDRPLPRLPGAGEHPLGVERREHEGVLGALADDHPARVEGHPARLQGRGDVRQVELGMAPQVLGQIAGRPLQGRRGAGGEDEELERPRRAPRRHLRRLLQNDVGIGATDAERAHPRPPRSRLPPGGRHDRHVERAGRQVDLRVRALEVQARRDHPALDRERRLEERGHARRRVEMPEIALERADGDPAAGLDRPGEDLGERLHLDRVAERRARAVRLDEADRTRLDPGKRLRQRDHPGLALDARHRVAELSRPVVVDRRAQDHGLDAVAVARRVRQPAQHDEPQALPLRRAGRRGVERTAVPVLREDAAGLMEMPALARHEEAHAAGERQVALAVE